MEGAAGRLLCELGTGQLSRVLWRWGWSCLEPCPGVVCSPEPLTWVAAGPSDSCWCCSVVVLSYLLAFLISGCVSDTRMPQGCLGTPTLQCWPPRGQVCGCWPVWLRSMGPTSGPPLELRVVPPVGQVPPALERDGCGWWTPSLPLPVVQPSLSIHPSVHPSITSTFRGRWEPPWAGGHVVKGEEAGTKTQRRGQLPPFSRLKRRRSPFRPLSALSGQTRHPWCPPSAQGLEKSRTFIFSLCLRSPGAAQLRLCCFLLPLRPCLCTADQPEAFLGGG